MASNDPTDTGGLFIGRRPGTAPVRYRDPGPSSEGRRRMDEWLANGLLAVEILLCVSLLGPQPAAWLWIGSQVDYLTGYVTAGIATIMIGCLASLMLIFMFLVFWPRMVRPVCETSWGSCGTARLARFCTLTV